MIAGAVAASVASATAGAAAGAAGGAAGGSGGSAGAGGAGLGPVVVMVDQVQIMSILGRTGGDAGSVSNKEFSASFGWANGEASIVANNTLTVFTQVNRTVSVPKTKDDSRRESANGICEEAGIPMLNKLIVSFGVLLIVASTRLMVKCLHTFLYPHDPSPPDLSFPAWEACIYVCLYVCLL